MRTLMNLFCSLLPICNSRLFLYQLKLLPFSSASRCSTTHFNVKLLLPANSVPMGKAKILGRSTVVGTTEVGVEWAIGAARGFWRWLLVASLPMAINKPHCISQSSLDTNRLGLPRQPPKVNLQIQKQCHAIHNNCNLRHCCKPESKYHIVTKSSHGPASTGIVHGSRWPRI